MAPTNVPALAFGELVDSDDTRRIKRLTEQGRHLEEDEYAHSVALRGQFRLEVERNPRMLRVYRHALGCLEADEDEAKLLDAENRTWRDSVKANKAAKEERDISRVEQDVKMRQEASAEKKRKKAAEEDKHARTNVVPVPVPVTRLPPSVLPTAARAEPTSLPNPPSVPPSNSRQGEKRSASDAARPPLENKKSRHIHTPAAGDWKCGSCGWWNSRVLIKCKRHHHGTVCGIAKDDTAFTHEVQGETSSIKFAASGARYYGDWRCGICKHWNSSHLQACRLCERGVDECKDAKDCSDKLDHPNWYYEDDSKTYWYGNNQGPLATASNPNTEHAKYLGVMGKSKDKKDPYRLRGG